MQQHRLNPLIFGASIWRAWQAQMSLTCLNPLIFGASIWQPAEYVVTVAGLNPLIFGASIWPVEYAIGLKKDVLIP